MITKQAMAKAKRKQSKIEVSSGNVFADLKLPDAEERQTKVQLAVAIQNEVTARNWSQAEAAAVLGINQPKVSASLKFRLKRLMIFLAALGKDIRYYDQAERPGAGEETFGVDGRSLEHLLRARSQWDYFRAFTSSFINDFA